MERRHQVFVSSTFKDLEEERQEIIYALLELDCMPAGMELFPATDSDAWNLIESVIDDSDYYLLVIGGRYGSTGADGIGFTEKEYDYAVASKKPVMAFLHSQPDNIPAGKSEKSAEGKTKLEAFKAKVQSNQHVRYWSNAAELGGTVSRSLVKLRRQYPSDGWVQGSYAMTDAIALEVEQLRLKVKELENELLISKNAAINTVEISELAQGIDEASFLVAYYIKPTGNSKEEHKQVKVKTTWNKVLAYVGPSLMAECDDETFLEKLQLLFYHLVPKDIKLRTPGSKDVAVLYITRDAIKTQLRALGYMSPGIKRRAVADKKTYWALTSVGEQALFQATAEKKKTVQRLP